MALPTTIVSDVGLAGYHPPFKSSGGDFYSVVRADADELDIYKATDPTDSWSVQDFSNGPIHVGTILGFTAVQDSDVIHIIAWNSFRYEYYTFNMATDAWAIDELMEAPANFPSKPWASIAVRSGIPVVGYAGDTDTIMGGSKERVDVAHRDGGSWTTGISLDAGGDIHYGNPNCVLGTSDEIHFIWQQTENITDPPGSWEDAQGRTLESSDNSLSNVDSVVSGTSSALLGFQNLVSYDDSGTQRIILNGSPPTGTIIRTIQAKEGGHDQLTDIDITASVTESVTAAVGINVEVIILTTAELSGDIHILYSGGGGPGGPDKDLYYTTSTDNGDSWTTETEEIDTVTVNFISANIYVRGTDTVMAYVYDDGGVQKYNEKVLIPGTFVSLQMLV